MKTTVWIHDGGGRGGEVLLLLLLLYGTQFRGFCCRVLLLTRPDEEDIQVFDFTFFCFFI